MIEVINSYEDSTLLLMARRRTTSSMYLTRFDDTIAVDVHDEWACLKNSDGSRRAEVSRDRFGACLIMRTNKGKTYADILVGSIRLDPSGHYYAYIAKKERLKGFHQDCWTLVVNGIESRLYRSIDTISISPRGNGVAAVVTEFDKRRFVYLNGIHIPLPTDGQHVEAPKHILFSPSGQHFAYWVQLKSDGVLRDYHSLRFTIDGVQYAHPDTVPGCGHVVEAGFESDDVFYAITLARRANTILEGMGDMLMTRIAHRYVAHRLVFRLTDLPCISV